jgi:hypothetical protein
MSKEQLELLAKINGYNLACRYPEDTYAIYKTLNAQETKKILKQAGDLREWILEKLNP